MIKVYEMTSLTSENCEVLARAQNSVTLVYGDVILTLTRPCEGEPFTWKQGKLQLMTTGDKARPLPHFRPMDDVVVAISSHRKYSRAA